MDIINPIPSLLFARQVIQNSGGVVTFTAGGANVLQISVPVRSNQTGFMQAKLNSGGSKGAVIGDVTWKIQRDPSSVQYGSFTSGADAVSRRTINVPIGATMEDTLGCFFVTSAAGNLVLNVFGASVGSDYTQPMDALFLAVFLFN